MDNLDFESIEFLGIEKLDPAFDPKIKEYTIHRKAGDNFRFKAKLNRPPERQTDEDGSEFRPYKSFSLRYRDGDNMSTKAWYPDTWHEIACFTGERTVTISGSLTGFSQEGEEPFEVILKVMSEKMTADEISACPHSTTTISEGEFWGGCSGSCIVELFTICVGCGVTLKTVHDYRD